MSGSGASCDYASVPAEWAQPAGPGPAGGGGHYSNRQTENLKSSESRPGVTSRLGPGCWPGLRERSVAGGTSVMRVFEAPPRPLSSQAIIMIP